ncbi:MAG TPA: hypothetical protein VFI22_15185 [Thermomicrobiales bacterium]|nr:hypothetical protein [Thermomicrobiales bacterium]
MKVARAAAAFGVTAGLVGGSLLLTPAASAANDKDASCGVQISGGTISNNTGIGLSANGGTSIADASGGGNNVAVPGGLGSVASAGNGGVSNAAANGGAISMGDVNSGGNAGNAISVGNTNCAAAPAKPEAPKKPEAPAKPGKAAPVVELPATGVGEFGMDLSAALGSMAAAAAMVAGGLNLRRRR